MNPVDNTYKQVVKTVLTEGNYKENRTGVDTISKFGISYSIDNSGRFPLLTTKKMDEGRWNSLIHELLWYLSGEYHVRNLQEHTSIWDAWADGNGNLDTAYGRFWRKYPVPGADNQEPGESWPDVEEEEDATFDQIQHVIENLKENPNSRRHVVSAWHPANAAESELPPCHYTFIFNVQEDDVLHLHLTQRSGDIAVGIPFNIASYCLLQRIVAQEVGMEVGEFNHTIVDAHVYCGEGERGEWWADNVDELPENYTYEDIAEITEWVNEDAPEDEENYDHIPGLLNQLTRTAHNLPQVNIADKPIDDLEYEDFDLLDYEGHESIRFGVAE